MGMGGGTTVTSQDPWAGAVPYLNNQLQGAWNLYHQGPQQYFPGQGYTDPTGAQMAPWDYGFGFMNNAFGGGVNRAPWSGPQDYTQAQSVYDPSRGPTTAEDGTVTYHGDPNTQYPGAGGGGMGPMPVGGSSRNWEWGPNGPSIPGGGGMGGSPMPASGGPGAGTPFYGDMVGANRSLLQGGPGAGMMGAMMPGAMGALGQAFGNPINAGFDASLGDPSQAIGQMLSGQPNYDAVQAATRAGAQPTLDILREEIMPELRSRTVSTNNPTGEIKDLNRIVPRVMRDISNAGIQAGLGEYNRAMSSRDQAAGLAGNLGLGLGNLGLQGDIAGRDTALGFGHLGLGAAGQQAQNMGAGVNQFGNVLNTGMTPFNMMQGYGDFTGGFEQQALNDAMNRWNFNEQSPFNLLNWYSGQITGAGSLGGTTQGQQNASPWSTIGGMAMMALPYMFSDRRLKRDIRPLGGGWYRFRYIWGEEAVGVMADEIPQQFVHFTPAGHAMVNYGALLEA